MGTRKIRSRGNRWAAVVMQAGKEGIWEIGRTATCQLDTQRGVPNCTFTKRAELTAAEGLQFQPDETRAY